MRLTERPLVCPLGGASAGIQRSSTHLSLLALYALGGHLVNNRLLPVGVLVTAIGFTFSLVFATQVGGRIEPPTASSLCSCMSCWPPLAAWGLGAGHTLGMPGINRQRSACPQSTPQGMLQTFVDLRGMLASVRRVQATLSELPPDESMAQSLPLLPDTPWECPAAEAAAAAAAAAAGGSSSSVNGSSVPPGLPDESPVPLPAAAVAAYNGGADGHSWPTRAVEAAQQGDLRLEGVTFSYPVRPGARVLKGLSLTLPRGKVTALVGR